jgi:hypothetical protein
MPKINFAVLLLFCLSCSTIVAVAQSLPAATGDSSFTLGNKAIVLTEVVVNSKLNVAGFITAIKNDSSFYKAFRNLRIMGFSAINDIRMMDKKGNATASLYSKTRQYIKQHCRFMETSSAAPTGDFYDVDGQYNYYTAQMYAALFFTTDSVCGETNIVENKAFSTAGKSGIEKHKEQLKMLFFNPGKRIEGLPFMSNKTAIYDDEMAAYYDMQIDMEVHNKTSCYLFKQKVKPGLEDHVVVDEMTTWFDDKTMEIVARNYSISYSAMVYDFKVNMEVEMTHAGGLLVPSLIRYNGNWKAIFKKRERGVFTATLYNFEF